MFHSSKKANINTNMNSHHDNRGMSACVQGDSGLVLTTDPKPRLRWTVELHERFVDAVTQLGGPDSMSFYPKSSHTQTLIPRLVITSSKTLAVNLFRLEISSRIMYFILT